MPRKNVDPIPSGKEEITKLKNKVKAGKTAKIGKVEIKDNDINVPVSSKSVKMEKPKRKPNKYIRALGIFNNGKKNYQVVRKGSRDYATVMKIMKTLEE